MRTRVITIAITIACAITAAFAQPGPGAGRDAGPDARMQPRPDAPTGATTGATTDARPAARIDAGTPAPTGARDAAAVPTAGSAAVPGAVPGAGPAAPAIPRDAGVVDAVVPVDAAAPAPVDAAQLLDAGVPPADAIVIDAGVPTHGGLPIGPWTPVDAISGGVVPIEPVEEPAPEITVPLPFEDDESMDDDLLQDAQPPVEVAPAGPPASKETTVFAIKVIIGLIILLVLAYLGGHQSTVRLLERLGISGVITAGFPFVALGLIASLPSVGILTDDIIPHLRPLLQFGLGWLGFIIGAQLDIRVLDRVPKGTAYLIFVEALGPFALAAVGCGAVMLSFGESLHDPSLWRDIVLLGTAAAMTAPRKFRGFANRTWHEGRGADVLLGQMDEIVGVIGLLFLTAYFRDGTASGWQLPGTAWVFVSLGLGVTIGALIFAMIRVPVSNAEFLAVVLGAVAFASGLAGYLRLSPIVICFVAGVLVTNFPNDQRSSVFRILNHLERPVHLMFLMIAGALWTVGDWRGWVLVPLFVLARIVGKWTGVLTTKMAVGTLLPPGFVSRRKLVVPMSSLAIALVISVERFRSVALPWVITAVIGGAVVTELLVQATRKIGPEPETPKRLPAAPIDELDERESAGADAPVHSSELGDKDR